MTGRDLPVEIKDLSIDYGKYPVIQNFSLTVTPGEAVLIRGPSGCGKSTLLHSICGLIPRTIPANVEGQVLIFGNKPVDLTIEKRAKEVGIVFQNPETQLFSDSVEDEIAFGLENLCVPSDKIGERIEQMLSLVQMEDFRYASPRELSGGQKQRIVLASVLAIDPKILLLDEALSQMDLVGKQILISHLEVLRKQGRTMLMVDHDDTLAKIASRVVELV